MLRIIKIFNTWILIVLLIVFGGFAIWKACGRPERLNPWEDPVFTGYYAFQGSKGPVIWELGTQLRYAGERFYSSPRDSLRFFIRITDPINSDKRETEIERCIWQKEVSFSDPQQYRFLQGGNAVYNSDGNGNIRAFNIYTGEQVLTKPEFEKKFIQFEKDTIVGMYTVDWSGAFFITTEKRNQYYYYPGDHLLRKKNYEEESPALDTVSRKRFFFRKGAKSALYSKDGPEHNYPHGYIPAWEHNVVKVGNREYYFPQRLIDQDDYAIIAHRTESKEDAEVVLERLDRDGTSLWRTTDLLFKNVFKQHYPFCYGHSGDSIVFYNTAWFSSVGIDLRNGKILFKHQSGKK